MLTKSGVKKIINLLLVAVIITVVFQSEIAVRTGEPPAEDQTENQIPKPDFLRLPRLGIAAPVTYVEEEREDAFQKALERGVAHYPGTARAGEPGNVYLFGHSSDLPWAAGEYKTVFAPLMRVQIGDEVLITNESGKEFVYRVTETRVVSSRDLSVLDQSTDGSKILTLQTSYPLGTALGRFIVVAELAEKTIK